MELRPDKDLYFMRMARLVATRSTCLRRSVGCVLVDERGHVLSTGYNGVQAGAKHCNEWRDVGDAEKLKALREAGHLTARIDDRVVGYWPHACAGARANAGTKLEACAAVHGEQNALLQCRDVYAIHTAYVTTAPCDSCLKLFLNTACARIVVGAWYFDSEGASNERAVAERFAPRTIVLDQRP
jgi:dCMP deaminase